MSRSLTAIVLVLCGLISEQAFGQSAPLPQIPAKPDDAAKVPVPDPQVRELPDLTESLKQFPPIKPLAPIAIPDNPPPHEGELIDLPITIEPPDIIEIEVLESLPGRPIQGDRLVEPDGTISLGFYGRVHVRGLTIEQTKEKIVLHLRKHVDDQVLGLLRLDMQDKFYAIPPVETDRVFVHQTSYNSKVYFVQGDVGVPGRLPVTGKDTVLDALNYAGGLISTGEPEDIHLYRPARGGKPAKDYNIDHAAILKGDAKANLQMFPNDRLVVGRNAIMKRTIAIDRAAAPINSVLNTIFQQSLTARYVASTVNPLSTGNNDAQVKVNGQKMTTNTADAPVMTSAQRDAIMKEYFEFLWTISSKEGGATLDEEKFREALMKKLSQPTPVAPAPK